MAVNVQRRLGGIVRRGFSGGSILKSGSNGGIGAVTEAKV
jgi:hypothetical protein